MPFVNYQRRPLVFNEMGKPINDLSMEDAIKEANLDYKVGIKETRVRLEDPANPGSFLLYKVPNSFATYREDTNHVFGAVGSKYEVVQNSVALDFINQICDYDKSVRIETAGCYKNGASMLVTAKFPDAITIDNKDLIDKYLLFTNSHDGSGLITCAVTNIRVICNNMLNQAIKNATQQFSFKHTKNVHNAIMSAVNSIRATHIYHEAMQESMQALKAINIKSNNMTGFVYNLFLNDEQQEHLELISLLLIRILFLLRLKIKSKLFLILSRMVLVKSYIVVLCFGFIMV